MGDLDLLLPRQGLETAVQAVRSLGYHEVYPELAPGLNWPAGYHKHLRGGPHQGVDVELHWGLIASGTDWRSPPVEWFWNNTESFHPSSGSSSSSSPPALDSAAMISNSGVPLLTLTPTAHLLYLAAHLMLQHGGARARLLWFYDIHLLVNHWGSRMDWAELVERAREFQWSAALYAALRETQLRFETPMPDGFLHALAATGDQHETQLIQRKGGSIQTRAVQVWSELTTVDFPTRLRLTWGIVCPSPSYIRWRYRPRPAWLWPLCYVYRWLDILREGLSTLWRKANSK